MAYATDSILTSHIVRGCFDTDFYNETPNQRHTTYPCDKKSVSQKQLPLANLDRIDAPPAAYIIRSPCFNKNRINMYINSWKRHMTKGTKM